HARFDDAFDYDGHHGRRLRQKSSGARLGHHGAHLVGLGYDHSSRWSNWLSTGAAVGRLGHALAVQRPDGFWNVNLAYANDYPGPESSGTACFTYGMAWGINRGYLDTNTYLPAVIKGWN